MAPEIPFATTVAIQARDDILKTSSVVELLADSLSSPKSLSVIPAELAAHAIAGLTVDAPSNSRVSTSRRLRQTAKAWAPAWAARLLTPSLPTPMLNYNRIAFRAYLVERTTALLQQDAALLS